MYHKKNNVEEQRAREREKEKDICLNYADECRCFRCRLSENGCNFSVLFWMSPQCRHKVGENIFWFPRKISIMKICWLFLNQTKFVWKSFELYHLLLLSLLTLLLWHRSIDIDSDDDHSIGIFINWNSSFWKINQTYKSKKKTKTTTMKKKIFRVFGFYYV